MRLADMMLLQGTHTHVCVRLDESCPWLHSCAGPPFPTLSQECWRQRRTGSAKGKTEPGPPPVAGARPRSASRQASPLSSSLTGVSFSHLQSLALELMLRIGLSLKT